MNKGLIAFALASTVAAVYLFVNAPPALPEASADVAGTLPVGALLEICADENAAVRELYTREIVGAGTKAGLVFDEKWKEPTLDAGPLPALFLRETAERLAKSDARLGLFLGSDHPISAANRFTGAQAEAFDQMRRDEKPRHFELPELGVRAAMFPDVAVVAACVDCHNEHQKSPKRDWKLGDIMGATTFTYPASRVSAGEALRVITALRRSFLQTYSAYTDKAKTFASPPTIGAQWPTSGYFLPAPDRFLRQAEERMSRGTLARLLAAR